MPRSKKQTQGPRRVKTITEEELQVPIEEEYPPTDEELLELETFFSQLGDEDVRYKLYRVQKGGKRVWLEDGTPETFSEASIQESHGEGDYLIRAISGRHWIKAKQISIGPPSGGSQREEASDHVRALELRLREVELQAQQAREAEMRRQHELTVKLIENLGTQTPSQSGPTLNELITGVHNLRDLGGNSGGSLDSIKEVLEVVNEINTLRGDDSGESGFLSLLKPIVPDLAKMLLERGAIPTPSGGTAPGGKLSVSSLPSSPVMTPTGQNPPTPPEAEAGVNGMEAQFQEVKRQALAYALGMARLGRPPSLYADLAMETVDLQGDPLTARLIQEIADAPDFDAWFNPLQAIEPALITQRDWFLEFFETVREAVSTGKQPGESEANPADETGGKPELGT